MEQTIKQMHMHYGEQKIVLPIVIGNIFISWKDVCHFKSDGNYCKMITLDGKEQLITKSLKWIEMQLIDTSFYRIHKSYLINIYHIEEYHKAGNGSVVMKSRLVIPISRAVKQEVCMLMNCS